MPEPVVEDVWRIDLGHVNAYLIATDEGPLLVDAGLPGKADEIREAIRETGQDPEDLQAVLVTHTDLDHVGALADLLEGNQAQVYLSPVAAEILTGQHELPWLSSKALFQRVTARFVDAPPVVRFEPVDEDEQVHGLRVIATPGHGLGHVCFVREADGLVFAGDLVHLDRAEPRIAPWVINYDTDQAGNSLRHLLEEVEHIQTVCAGHGPPMEEDARERLERLVG